MIARLVRDPRGATFVEFALLSPVLCLLLLGALDICHRAYAQALLSGAVQAAGRKGTLEGNDTTAAALAIDEAVIRQIRPVAPHLRWTSNRAHYRSYDSVAAEPFNDANGNGSRDAGECFTDINANKRFDLDAGATGQGGANDVTVYTMTVTFPRLFPMSGMLGLPRDQVVSSTTSLKNQPYGSQSSEAPETLCT